MAMDMLIVVPLQVGVAVVVMVAADVVVVR